MPMLPQRIRHGSAPPGSVRELATGLGWCDENGAVHPERLPFSGDDATAGSETELQVAVAGRRDSVDLPLIIEQSDYFANIVKRAASGDSPKRLISALERFLATNCDGVWENSWVRFPRRLLSPLAQRVFLDDLRADKKDPTAGRRSDAGRFFIAGADGEEWLRLPVSYLLKLALADVLGTQLEFPAPLAATGRRLMEHFLNDNTSPETFSFHVVPLRREDGRGAALAKETALRYLLTQLLLMYANERFGLRESGQQALIYFAPHPPVRQKELNSLIADAFYRELFMSPCLSGWDRGEEKYRYMQLCHQVLSRSQLNAVAKLKEAGIISNNLVVLPSVSNVSLANNGLHLSLGSRRLGSLLAAGDAFNAAHEKYLGDLVIKIVEHFLPLFVGTYSAAPYRLGFTDFHPERALGFLPHELDFTHLRMIWRRWQKKASLAFFGHPVTPFGPPWLDRLVSRTFGLRGDFVPDFRLIDYLVCLLSTPQSPALDGRPGNGEKLRKDLADLGVFDGQMSVYLLYKLREYGQMGFSGFEGRHYSLFPSLTDDLARATDLQLLITALSYRLVVSGEVSHAAIPDEPTLESERRQVFFAAAIGLPTFFVRRDTGNRFLAGLLARTGNTRPSRRYPGYLRVPVSEYRQALASFLAEEGREVAEQLGLTETLRDLRERLLAPDERGAAGRLTREILQDTGKANPMAMPAEEFNSGAESFYREALRHRHLQEGLELFSQECAELERAATEGDQVAREGLAMLAEGSDARSLLAAVRQDLLRERLPAPLLRRLIGLLLACVQQRSAAVESFLAEPDHDRDTYAPVRRAGHR